MTLDNIRWFEQVRAIALALDAVVLSTSYGTPAYKVNKKLIVRFWEDGKTIVVYTEDRDKWLNKKSAAFFITEHYRNYPWVLVDLSKVRKNDLEEIITTAWKLRMAKKIKKDKN